MYAVFPRDGKAGGGDKVGILWIDHTFGRNSEFAATPDEGASPDKEG